MKLSRCLALALACLPLALHAQNTVFNDSFTGDSLEPTTYPAVTGTTTGWQIASSKAAPAPTNTSGLQFNMVSTSSGFIESQALFAPAAAPVQLLPGTFIELTGVFTPTNVMVHASDVLNVGLFNANGSAPITGMQASGLSNALTTLVTGGAMGWQGYNAYIAFTAGTSKMDTRAAQTSTNNTNQDLLVGPESTTAGYDVPAPVSIIQSTAAVAALTNGNTYTLDYKLSLAANGTTLTATYNIYNGAGTTGSGANTLVTGYTGTISGATLLTTAFNGMSLGWRADASLVSDLNFSSLVVNTTGGAPWFITEPLASSTVSTGSTLTLTAVVGGTVTTFQWQKSTDGGATFANVDPTANPSAATTALSISGVQATDAGTYRLIVTNAAGSTTSTPAVVNVTSGAVPPSIASNPIGTTVTVGGSYTFSVTANGTSPLSYQWNQSTDGGVTFNPVAGATNSTYAISPVGLANAGVYTVTVTNIAGSVTSNPATLNVVQPPSISVQPAGTTLAIGASYTLSISASGTPPPTFQWYLNGSPIIGATSSTFKINSASGASAGEYTVVISNSAGANVTSAVASIAVLSPTLTSTAVTPASGATGLNPDTRLSITFNQAVSVGVTGQINIFDAANPSAPVDTIDLVAGTALMNSLRASSTVSTQLLPVQNKTVGGLTNFNYYPITVSGNTATIYPRNNVLTYGHSYFVTVDAGVFTDGTGLSYPGLSGSSAWTFSTKGAGPAAGATALLVAADGSGDFTTVQGALDFIPSGNTTPTTITINPGTYFEQIYFTGKHAITFLGADRTGTVIVYPNNNTFNNVTGTYHRMVFQADHVNNVVVKNLTVENSTPHGGSQAESLLLNGTLTAQAIVTGVNLVSFQDTLQINGQAYVSDSHISGDVDFIWGQGPNFFNNCELTALTSAGYYTQIRNPSTNHGNVFFNCTLDSANGVTGSFLGRIDPTVGTGFPFSEVVYINCVMGSAVGGTDTTNISPAGWLLNNTPDQTAASAPNVHFWEYNSHFADGTPLNVSSRIGASQQLTQPASATTIANYSTPSFVLGNGLNGTPWVPAQPPTIQTSPSSASVPQGGTATFTVVAAGAPEPTFAWFMNGVALVDGPQPDGSIVVNSATATLTVQSVAADENAAAFTAVATNSAGSVTSSPAILTVLAALPSFTAQPAAETVASGSGVTFSATVSGATSVQWLFNGSPITGNPTSTTSTLTLGTVTPLSAGTYSLAATNAGGTLASSAAILNVTAAPGTPTLPVIPSGVFKVTAFGALGDGATDNTATIQATINAAIAAGGGTVEVPPAAQPYLSGPLTFGSSISLQVDAGATLQALPFGTYPDVSNAPAVFIAFKNASNVQVVGGGTIDGNGAAWWAAFNGNSSTERPQMIKFSNCTNVLVAGVTLSNAPTEHLVPAATNLTIDGITVATSATSPNTDGIDPSGTNLLIENCSISDGDDNIAIKPQNLACSNITITNCAFGSGHGLSIGGQTNDGLNGLTVTNCTFNGTTTGLRLKADPTEGGLVQNLSYSNLTMTNVQSPIVFYSYYNEVGSPGAVSGSNQTTPAKVLADNATPPNSLASSTLPAWQNITISNLTATGASAYSIIWGLPLANGLFNNVVLNNVNISGGNGLEIYDATNVQLTGNSNVGPILTANSLAITGQPQSQTAPVGNTVVFSAAAAGASGVANTAATYQWSLNGTALVDGMQADGSTVAGSATGTLTISNLRVTDAGSYVATVSNMLDGFNVGTNALSPNSLPVSAATSAAVLTVQPVAATLTLSNTTQTYTGLPEVPKIVSSPVGAVVTVTYNGSSTAPTMAGTYAVVATVNDPNYTGGSATGTFTIAPAIPVITWTAPAAIPFGTPLGAAQLDATANVPGTFVYTPAAGTVLQPGANQAISATFTPTDAVDFTTGVSAAQAITVNPGVATITLGNLSQVYTGAAHAVSVVTTPTGLATSVTYNGSGAAPVAAGAYAVVATITDPNFTGTTSGTLVITKATATVTLGALSQTFGGGIEDANAATNPPGLAVIWSYNGLPLAFTPTGDTLAAYAPAVGQTLYVNVTGATGGTVSGTNPTFGITSDLGTAAVQGGILTVGQAAVLQVAISADGTTFAIVGIATTGFTAGPIDVGTYAVTGTIVDPNYNGSVSGSLSIVPATPTITWSAPAPITFGTALGAAQLDAMASVPGTFAYTPAAGTVLGAGANQPLSVVFTATDSTDYTTATAGTTISVTQTAATVTLGNTSQTYSGSPEAVSVTTSPVGLSTAVTYGGSATVPTAAGSYAVVATISDPNYSGSVTGTLVIAKATPILGWSTPATILAGAPLTSVQLDATSTAAGTFVYTPAAGTILAAGANQALSATFTPTDTVDIVSGGTVGTTITVLPSVATVTLGNLSQVYNGSARPVSVTTAPSGLSTSVTYNGSATVPVVAGSYAVVATVTSPSFTGSASGTLVITKGTPALTWNPPAAITAGTALGSLQLNATANVAGTFAYTPAAGTVLAVGTGHVLSALFTPTDTADYTTASVSTTITVNSSAATITLGDLNQAYTGSPLTVTATTNPANLAVSITYNGSTTAPTYPGTYAVVATITDPSHTGSASGTLTISTTALVNQAPTLNGNAAFTGSIQMLLPQSVNMSGNAFISNDLLVPGTPSLQTSGNAKVAGTINAGGVATPTNYQITMSGNTVLRHLVRQINPLTMPTVAAPPSSNQNVTLNGNAPPTALAPGNYGSVIVNGNTTLILGEAGATTASVYNIQNLTVNGNGVLQVVGPVNVIVANGPSLNGNGGAGANPQWLVLLVANGGVTLNSNVTFNGSIVAPKGQVIINSNSTVNGTIISDSLLLNGGAVNDPGL